MSPSSPSPSEEGPAFPPLDMELGGAQVALLMQEGLAGMRAALESIRVKISTFVEVAQQDPGAGPLNLAS